MHHGNLVWVRLSVSVLRSSTLGGHVHMQLRDNHHNHCLATQCRPARVGFPQPRPPSGPWLRPVFIFYWTLLPTLHAVCWICVQTSNSCIYFARLQRGRGKHTRSILKFVHIFCRGLSKSQRPLSWSGRPGTCPHPVHLGILCFW